MTVRDRIKRDPQGLVSRAYAFAQKAHAKQKRQSGEPYITHPLAAADITTQWGLDDTTIAAALLHDSLEDTSATREELVASFGEDIAFIVDGVTKLGRIKYRGAEGKIENLRKMILALSQDLRVIFVKLADRLHNIRTLGALPPAKQKRIALETSEIYAPIASRLGMHEISGELQDLAFPYLHPAEDRWIRAHVTEEYAARKKYLEKVQPLLRDLLSRAKITPLSMDFRAKRHYSLYRKLLRYNMDLNRIYDLVALRVIVPKIEDCYAALGIVHHEWRPLPGRIKDYIAMPKANNYRSLHTTVIGPEGRSVEIQFRTPEMHQENEFGIAAHWIYKERSHSTGHHSSNDSLEWIKQLTEWQERYATRETDPTDFLNAMKVEFFKDRVFTITPKGDVIDLPAGATPIDFAYHIHSEIGNTCVGAKVNHQFVPLDHPLTSGDLVEIITQKNKRPSSDWIAFVKTTLARDRIRGTLRDHRGSLTTKVPTKTELRIVVEDRVGLIKDIAATIARSHINILNFSANHSPSSRYPIDRIECATTDRQKIEKLILKLKKIKEVKEISYRFTP